MTGRPIRVAQLFWEPRRSGITGHLLALARGFPRERVDPFFVVPEHLEDSRRELEAAGARVATVPLGNKLFPRAALDRLPALLRREKPDVIHVHALEAGLFGHHVRRAARVPRIVFTPHTDTIRRPLFARAYLALWRSYGRTTDVLLASTETQRERLVALGVAPRERVLLGPTGVRVPASPVARDDGSRRAARRSLGWPEEGRLVGQIGRLVVQKDPLLVVEVAHALAREGSSARVVLVGDGPLEEETRARARALGVADRIVFAGYARDLEPVYAALDVLLLASRWEGLSVVLLEAMARGLPIVATANDGNAAVVRDRATGRTAAPGDALALARATEELLAHPDDAARLGDAARALVEREYGERACAERIVQAYELALARPRASKTTRRERTRFPAIRTDRVTVAIPTYRRGEEVVRLLDRLEEADPKPFEVVVVDQTEEHPAAIAANLRARHARGAIRWLHHWPPSVTRARNRALAEAKGDLILMLDDEAEIPRDLIRLHARHFEDPTIGLTAGQVEEPGYPFEPWPFVVRVTLSGRFLVNFTYPHRSETIGFQGANFMVRRDVARAIGGWDERVRRAGHAEEMDVSGRLIATGLRILYDPEAHVVHAPSPRGGRRSYASIASFFRDHWHNEAYYFLLHQPAVLFPVFLLRTVVLGTIRAALGKRSRELPIVPGLALWPELCAAFVGGVGQAFVSYRHARRTGPLNTSRASG